MPRHLSEAMRLPRLWPLRSADHGYSEREHAATVLVLQEAELWAIGGSNFYAATRSGKATQGKFW